VSFHLRHDDRVKKGAPPYLNSYPSPPPLSLSLATGTGKGDVVERILLGEGSGPRALLLIRGSEAGPSEGFRQLPQSTQAPSPLLIRGSKAGPSEGFRQPPQSTRAPRPLLIRGSKAGPSEGFDSRPRACRVSDDSGYVRYMAEAQATLLRYPRTFPRPAGKICNGIPPEGGIEPSDPVEGVWVRRITHRYFWSVPLGHQPTPNERGTNIHSDHPLAAH
jgi:hypothetical protein